MITKFKIFESNNLDDLIIKCIEENCYKPLSILDKEYVMKFILNTLWHNLDSVNFKELIKYNFPLNVQDDQGNTVLLIYTTRDNIEMVKILIAAGVDLNIKNEAGNTALNYTNNKTLIKLLKSNGAKE